MLDVSIRIGLLNLMAELRDSEGVSILYITHDLASARYVADRLIVMYAGPDRRGRPDRGGAGPAEAPVHPAAAVRGARPARAAGRAAQADAGEPPRVIDPQPGCRFRWRCPLAIDQCQTEHPAAAGTAARAPGRLPRGPGRRRSEGVRMKIAVVGGGSTYTPELVDGIARLAGGFGRPGCHRAGPGRPGHRPAGRGRPGLGPDHAGARAPGRGALDGQPGRGPGRGGRGAAPAARRRAGGPAAGRDLAAGLRLRSARRPPAPAGWPRRCAPCRSCWTSPSGPGSGPSRRPGSSTSPTRSASSPGRCWTPGTARSACATWPSASSATSPRCWAWTPGRWPWTTSGSIT